MDNLDYPRCRVGFRYRRLVREKLSRHDPGHYLNADFANLNHFRVPVSRLRGFHNRKGRTRTICGSVLRVELATAWRKMPYVLILVGGILLVSGIRNTYGQLWTLVKNDFTGTNSFLPWIAAIAVVGGLGYVPKLRPLSIAFLTLLLLVLVLSNGGIFQKLQQFVTSGGATTPETVVAPVTPLSPLPPLSPQEQISSNISGLSNGR